MELRLLHSEDLSQIAELEKHLWKEKLNEREKKLIWKYVNVPEDKLLGAVAIENNEIIGFRGLVSSKWNTGGDTLKIIHFTDAVVSPDYRGKGVLSKLNSYLESQYREMFDFVMVFFPNEVSGHIYKSQGIAPFFKVDFFYRKFLLKTKTSSKNYEIVENSSEVCSMIENYYTRISQKIHLEYSKEYVTWKLNEPNKNLVVIRSINNPECFSILEDLEKKVEVQFFCEDLMNECLKLVENYAKSKQKSYINLPLSNQTNDKVKKAVLKRGFRTYRAMNLFNTAFFTSKEILLREFNEANKDISVVIKLPEHWDYQHFIYV